MSGVTGLPSVVNTRT